MRRRRTSSRRAALARYAAVKSRGRSRIASRCRARQRAIHAINDGYFQREIMPVSIPQRRGDDVIVDTDEHPFYRRANGQYELATSAEKLASLRPAFRAGGTVTAGNSSGMNDGACALVLMSADKARQLKSEAIGALAGQRGGRRRSARDGIGASRGCRANCWRAMT